MKKNYHIQSPPRMFEQVAKQIVHYIELENVKPNAKLPTERKLSESMGVSRSSVREGIRVLELLRFLESRQGEGTFVSNPPSFLIPYHVIGQKLVPADSDHYFDTALMCAEKIALLSLKQNVPYIKELTDNRSWASFLTVINDMGKDLKNPHVSYLWSCSFQLLSDNGYFADKIFPFDLHEFIAAYNQRNADEIKNLLNMFSNHI